MNSPDQSRTSGSTVSDSPVSGTGTAGTAATGNGGGSSTAAAASWPRPQLHFTPARNWMNDPNGLVFHDGRYHLFFQHNPHGNDHGNMSWGHASSPDLLTWTEHPIALWHDEVRDVFSGSVVVDEENTTGWADPATGRPALVAVYTAASRDGTSQAQALAYSQDGGHTWHHHDANPVLDLGTNDFRDPKVFRYHGPQDTEDAQATGRDWWVMVAVEALSRKVVLYRSEDLRTWTYLSSYGPAGAVGGAWECPDLFPLPVTGEPDRTLWVMLISLNPGAIAGGSGTQYVVGDFDGTTFTPLQTLPPLQETPHDLARAQWLDWGPDCYAGVTFNGLPDDERTFIAWMSNWDYAPLTPTSPWRGAMTLPRRLTLRRHDSPAASTSLPTLPPTPLPAPHQSSSGYVLEQAPVLPAPRSSPRGVDGALAQPMPLPAVCSIDLRVEFAEHLQLTVSIEPTAPDRASTADRNGLAVLAFDSDASRLTVTRSDGPTPDGRRSTVDAVAVPPSTTISAPVDCRDNTLQLLLIKDANTLEVFAGSRQSVTTILVPDCSHTRLRVEVHGHRPTAQRLVVSDLGTHPPVAAPTPHA